MIARYSRIGFVDPALNRGKGRRASFTQKKKSPALKNPNRDPGLQQIETTYGSNSHVILVTAKQPFHDETGTGALGTASTGVKARVSYAAGYFDGADQLTGVVDVAPTVGPATPGLPASPAGPTRCWSPPPPTTRLGWPGSALIPGGSRPGVISMPWAMSPSRSRTMSMAWCLITMTRPPNPPTMRRV